MKTKLDMLMMGVGIFGALLVIYILASLVIATQENAANHKLADEYCLLKGYDASDLGELIKEQFKEFKGEKYVRCYKDLVDVDDKGKATFKTIIDWVIYKP